MESIQSVGEPCPICGHHTLIDDYYYKTGEEYLFCIGCGYKKSRFIKRDGPGKLERRLTRTIDLSESNVFVGLPGKIGDNHEITSLISPVRIVPEMTQDEYMKLLCASDAPQPETFIQMGEEYQRVIQVLFTLVTIDRGKMTVMEPEWRLEESGGYGILSMRDGHNGCKATYILPEGSTIKSVLDSIKEEGRADIEAIVVFSQRGSNPSFYNTDESWFSQYKDI